MGFRTVATVRGESEPCRNALVFGTHEEADNYGRYKLMLWVMCTGYTVEQCDEVPNYTYHNYTLEPVPACVVCEQPSTCLCEVGGEA